MTHDWERAVRDGDAASVRRLLADGADVNARDRYGQTALMLAAHAGNLPVVDLLIDAGADLNVVAKFNLSAAMLAALGGHEAVARRLADAGADLSCRGSGAPGFAGLTAADLARQQGFEVLAAYLAARGA